MRTSFSTSADTMILPETLRRVRIDDAEMRLTQALAELDRERRAVAEIQRSLLPEFLPDIPGIEMSAYYQPSHRAGGDYYDVVPLVDDQWGFVMADVSGHGTPAAVIMTVLRTLIHANLPTNRTKSSGKFLETVNEVMSSTYLRNGRFVTIWAAVLNPRTRQLEYSSAGHNPPRLVRRGKVIELDEARGIPIGVEPDTTYEDHAITLEPNDLLVIYTDGITEAMRPGVDSRELFGTDRLDQVLTECGLNRPGDCTDRVTNAVAEFTDGADQSDDQTMLIVRSNQ